MTALEWLNAVPAGRIIEIEFRTGVWARLLRTSTGPDEWHAVVSRAGISTERLARIADGRQMRLAPVAYRQMRLRERQAASATTRAA